MAHSSPTKAVHVVKKGPWSQVEDELLIHLVQTYGPEQWMEISKDHGSRNAKQCRERYHQNLKPSINRGPITADEGVAIERLHAEKGPKWAEISRAIGGRSDNQVKNWYNGQKNRRTKHAHNGQQVSLYGTQQSLSAVRPVDAHMLQQRGHINPYSHCDIGQFRRCKPSPTTSQISEAPSLISDAGSTSPGISPSSTAAYPASANPWPISEPPAQSTLPPLHRLPPLLPFNTSTDGSNRCSVEHQGCRPAAWETKKLYASQGSELLSSRHDHVKTEKQSQALDNPRPCGSHPKPGSLPSVRSLLSTRNTCSTDGRRILNASPAMHSPCAAPRTLPRLLSDPPGNRVPQLVGSHCGAPPGSRSLACLRHEPYPSSRIQTIAATVPRPDGMAKRRMSLANVLG